MNNDELKFYKYGEPKALLNIKLQSRDAWAFPYTYLAHIQFIASGKLWLLYTTRAVLIEGRNLQELYETLVAGEVQWIREGNEKLENSVPEKEPFIAKITILSVDEYETKS